MCVLDLTLSHLHLHSMHASTYAHTHTHTVTLNCQFLLSPSPLMPFLHLSLRSSLTPHLSSSSTTTPPFQRPTRPPLLPQRTCTRTRASGGKQAVCVVQLCCCVACQQRVTATLFQSLPPALFLLSFSPFLFTPSLSLSSRLSFSRDRACRALSLFSLMLLTLSSNHFAIASILFPSLLLYFIIIIIQIPV